jgi:UDP-N-acetylglucosamine diphosphorylase/glucosamine-1-phosphate N-acetyltransferase
MKAVILAAGKGTRLYPLTDKTPKPVLPVGGRPLLEWMLDRVKEAEINEVLIVTNYLEDQIMDRFGDGEAYGIQITYKTQEKAMGTADAFNQAADWVGDNDFLALYGDHYLKEGVLKRIKDAHIGGEATVAVLKVEDPSQYGAFAFNGEKISKIVEKPPKGEEPSKYANVGIYVFPPDVFSFIEETKKSSRGEYEITDTMQLMIDAGVTLRRHDIKPGEWLDIGLPWNLLEANSWTMEKLEHRIEGDVEEGVTLLSPVLVRKRARVRSGAYIEGPVIIGEECDVGPNCYIRPFTCLGRGVRVGNACEIKNSIIMDGTHVAHLSYVGDSVIGKDCNLGAGTITANLRFDKSNIEVTVRGERMDSGRMKLGVIFGDGVQTGVNVSLHPGVIAGSDAWIAPGVTVQRDVKGGTIKYILPDIKERVK